MDFISGPVISGFCSAAAATVIFSQLKTILGLKFPGSSFVKVFPGIFANWRNISLWDTVLGFAFILLLLILKVIFPHCQSNDTRLKNKFSRIWQHWENLQAVIAFVIDMSRRSCGLCQLVAMPSLSFLVVLSLILVSCMDTSCLI